MTANPFDSDAPYLTHPRSSALHYEPLPAEALAQLARLERLMRHAPNAEELDWLIEQAAAEVTAECETCPPLPVRGQRQPTPRPRRHEPKYWRRKAGPRNKSGRAKS
jgi:hypothetical protein